MFGESGRVAELADAKDLGFRKAIMKLVHFVLPFGRAHFERSGNLPSVVSGASELLMKKFLPLMLLLVTTAMACAQPTVSFSLDSNHAIYFTPDPSRMLAVDATATAQGMLIAGQGLYTGDWAGQPGSITALPSHQTFTAALYGGPSSNSMTLQATTTIADAFEEGLINPVTVNGVSAPGTVWTWKILVFSGPSPGLGSGIGTGAAGIRQLRGLCRRQRHLHCLLGLYSCSNNRLNSLC